MKDKIRKYLLPNLPYLFFVYLFDKLCQAVRLAPGLDASEKLLRIAQGLTEAFASLWLSLHPLDLLLGVAGAALVRLTVYVKGKNAKKYRKGIEYGSARWGTAADIAPYIDPVPDWNIPLTRTESLTMTSRPKRPKYARNKNILVIGGSGSGKTRFTSWIPKRSPCTPCICPRWGTALTCSRHPGMWTSTSRTRRRTMKSLRNT